MALSRRYKDDVIQQMLNKGFVIVWRNAVFPWQVNVRLSSHHISITDAEINVSLLSSPLELLISYARSQLVTSLTLTLIHLFVRDNGGGTHT